MELIASSDLLNARPDSANGVSAQSFPSTVAARKDAGGARRIPMSRSRSALAALVAGVTASSAAAQVSITDLGVLPGGIYTGSRAISTDGSAVVGRGVTPGGTNALAFRWTAAGGMQNLGSLPGDTDSSASAINADGSVVAGYSGIDSVYVGTRAFRWTAANGMQDLGFLPGTTRAQGQAINADGSVVVGSCKSSGSQSSDERAFRWTAADAMQDLGVLPGMTYSKSEAISADGSVVAGSSGNLAFRWTASGGMQSLGFLPGGGSYSRATAISADGSAVAGLADDFPFGTRAFRWTAAGGMQNLGSLPGEDTVYNAASRVAISADGSTVVGSFYTPHGWHPFLWTPALGMVELNTYLESLGLDLTGWTLRIAFAISADGSAITGSGYFNGESRAYLISAIPTGFCFADFDKNTFVNGDDYDAFAALFYWGEPGADIDHNEFVNGDDYDLFMDHFIAGC